MYTTAYIDIVFNCAIKEGQNSTLQNIRVWLAKMKYNIESQYLNEQRPQLTVQSIPSIKKKNPSQHLCQMKLMLEHHNLGIYT